MAQQIDKPVRNVPTTRTNALADRYGDIDPDSPYWAALELATELEIRCVPAP